MSFKRNVLILLLCTPPCRPTPRSPSPLSVTTTMTVTNSSPEWDSQYQYRTRIKLQSAANPLLPECGASLNAAYSKMHQMKMDTSFKTVYNTSTSALLIKGRIVSIFSCEISSSSSVIRHSSSELKICSVLFFFSPASSETHR